MSLNPVRIDTTEHHIATSADLYGENTYYFAIDSRGAGDTKKLPANEMATTDWVKSWVSEQNFGKTDFEAYASYPDMGPQDYPKDVSRLGFYRVDDGKGYVIDCSAKDGTKEGPIGHFAPIVSEQADSDDMVLVYDGGPRWQSTHGDVNNQGEGGRQADWNETDPKSPRYIWNKPAGTAFSFIDISIAGANTYTLVTQALADGKLPVLVQSGSYGYKAYYTLETKHATQGSPGEYVFRSMASTNNWDIVQECVVAPDSNPEVKSTSTQLRLVSPPKQTEDNMIIVANSATGRADWKSIKWLLDGGQVSLRSRPVGDGYPNRYTMGLNMLSVEWYQLHPGIFVPLEKTSSSTSYSYKRTRFPQEDPVIATIAPKVLDDPNTGGTAGNSNTLRYGSIISLNFTANLWKREEYPAWIRFRLMAISDNNPGGNAVVDIKSVVLPGYEASSSCPGGGSNQTINLNFHGMLGGWEDPRDDDETESRYHLSLEIDRLSLAEGHVLVEDGDAVKTTDFELTNYQISGIGLNND